MISASNIYGVLILASLEGDTRDIWDRVTTAAQSQLFWIAAIVAVVCLTPNKTYGQLWTFTQWSWKKWGPKVTPSVTPDTPPAVVTPAVNPAVVIDPKKITTAQDLSNLYQEFRRQKAARIAELELLLAKERKELSDLDMISVVTPVGPSLVEVTP